MDDQPLAYDQIQIIRDWLDHVEHELDKERISLSELVEIDSVYALVKDYTSQ